MRQHLKNWSLVYPDGRRARLSPAYDLVSTIACGPGLDRLALRLSGEKDFSRITRAHERHRVRDFVARARRVVHATRIVAYRPRRAERAGSAPEHEPALTARGRSPGQAARSWGGGRARGRRLPGSLAGARAGSSDPVASCTLEIARPPRCARGLRRMAVDLMING
ncbi:HipA domain-containing protein [Sorangium sp. So ce367]|uniref:HipA domain-containing protein n=1 Tax=Sorangium sp. So ce367 TaxID=3133305 RepID=UPI003F63BA7C